MAGLEDLGAIQAAVQTLCPLYTGGLLGAFMYVWDFFPFMLTAVAFFVSLYNNEIYFFVASLFLTSDMVLNMVLRLIFQEPGPYAGCGAHYQNPSYSSEHSTFFVIMLVTFIMMWRSRLSGLRLFLLNLFYALVLTARIYIGTNTNFQLMMGGVTGTLYGVLIQLYIYYILYPRFDQLLSLAFVQWLGMENRVYKDQYLEDERTALGTVTNLVPSVPSLPTRVRKPLAKYLWTVLAEALVVAYQLFILFDTTVVETQNQLPFAFWAAFVPSLTLVFSVIAVLSLQDNIRIAWHRAWPNRVELERLERLHREELPAAELLRIYQIYILTAQWIYTLGVFIPAAVVYRDDMVRLRMYLLIPFVVLLVAHIIFAYSTRAMVRTITPETMPKKMYPTMTTAATTTTESKRN
jgi:hypothetical protein